MNDIRELSALPLHVQAEVDALLIKRQEQGLSTNDKTLANLREVLARNGFAWEALSEEVRSMSRLSPSPLQSREV